MKNILLAILLFSNCFAYGSNSNNSETIKGDTILLKNFAQTKRDSIWRKRNFIWFAPVAHKTTINGWAISAIAVGAYGDSLIINCLNTEIGIGMYLLPYLLFDPNGNLFVLDSCDSCFNEAEVIINGLSASLMGHFGATKINGVSLNGVTSWQRQCNGVVVSLLGNITGGFNGFMGSAIINKACKGRGVQLSLFNYCSNFKGIQIGLINKNQKRTLPFINWSFKD